MENSFENFPDTISVLPFLNGSILLKYALQVSTLHSSLIVTLSLAIILLTSNYSPDA